MQRNIIVTLECFIKKDGKYLMLHRHPNKRILPNVWMGPGGKIEFNEGLFEAARREVLEETGLRIKNLQIRSYGNGYLKDIDQEVFFTFLTADWAEGEVVSEAEVGELVWLTPDEILNLDNLLSELRQVLPHVLSNKKEVISYKVLYESGNNMSKFTLEDPK